MFPRVSCILPAYNEAPRIAAVLACVRGHPLIDEVIVVDDGSTDGTAALVPADSDVRLIVLQRNGGKSAAIAAGVRTARHDLLMFLDSDLLGLRAEHLTSLIEPVRACTADATISLRGNAPLPWRMIGLDYISGERVVHRHLLPSPQTMESLPRFGLEVAMNARWIAARARIAVVAWPMVESPLKQVKHGVVAGLRADAGMLADIFATVRPHRAALQIWQMWRLMC